ASTAETPNQLTACAQTDKQIDIATTRPRHPNQSSFMSNFAKHSESEDIPNACKGTEPQIE
ncbi:MAG: hypothetical protein QXG21_06375, partial [Candidatus Caldarchaeum sp.]